MLFLRTCLFWQFSTMMSRTSSGLKKIRIQRNPFLIRYIYSCCEILHHQIQIARSCNLLRLRFMNQHVPNTYFCRSRSAIGSALQKNSQHLQTQCHHHNQQCQRRSVVTLADIETPAFIINKHAFVKNCQDISNEATRIGVDLRPHVKTHKTVEGALIQANPFSKFTDVDEQGSTAKAAVSGFVASTLSEIELLASANAANNGAFDDILYGVPIGADEKRITRITELVREFAVNIHVMVDHEEHVEALEAVSSKSGIDPLSVFLKIDTGYGRAGVPFDDERGISIVHKILDSSLLSLKGIYSHCGHSYDVNCPKQLEDIATTDVKRMKQFLNTINSSTQRELRLDISKLVVSVGSTPSLYQLNSDCNIPNLEIHPGNYTLFDRQQLWANVCTEADVAGRVLARVIGHYPDRNGIMLDAGATALTKETTPQGGYGSICGFPDLECFKMSQEVMLARPRNGSNFCRLPYEKLPLGSVLSILPNHSCLAAAYFDKYHVIDDTTNSFSSKEEVVETWIPAKFW